MSGVLTAEMMSPVLVYRGFAFSRPTQKEWFVRIDEQSPDRALLRRTMKSKTHSVYFAAGLKLLDRAPQNASDFMRVVKPDLGEGASSKDVIYKPRLVEFKGQWAVEYDLTAKITARDGKILEIRDRGLIIRHPMNNVAALHLVIAQRGKEGEIDPKLDGEGEKLFDGVTLDPTPR